MPEEEEPDEPLPVDAVEPGSIGISAEAVPDTEPDEPALPDDPEGEEPVELEPEFEVPVAET